MRYITQRATTLVAIGAGVCFLVLSLSSRALALDPEKAITQYIHNWWGPEQGLTQKDVWAIVQTHDGYLWIGTMEGLLRFDGVSFTVFDKRNTPGLKQSYILSLFVDSRGILWIGTKGGGLTQLKDGQFTAYTTEQGLSDNTVQTITESQDGSLWIGTNRGLTRFYEGKFTAFGTAQGLANDSINAVQEDQAGTLWIGSDGGLDVFKDGHFIRYPTVNSADHNADPVMAIAVSKTGGLWVGFHSHGLLHIKDGSQIAYTIKDGLSSDAILSLHEDLAGGLWVGAFGGGVNRLQGARFPVFSPSDG